VALLAEMFGVSTEVRVWTWIFTVGSAAELGVVAGSVQRESVGSDGAGDAHNGNSISGSHHMYFQDTTGGCAISFHLGAISNITFTGFTAEKHGPWTYTIDGAPSGFLISPSTGEVQGSPSAATPNITAIRIMVEDRIGRVAVVESFELKVHAKDIDVHTNGPNGIACDPTGTLLAVDGEPFDDSFTCECLPTMGGENCEVRFSLSNRHKSLNGDSAKGVGMALGAVAILVVFVVVAYRVRQYTIKMAPTDFSALQSELRPREIRRGCVTLLERIGAGNFGEVWKASLRDGYEENRQHDMVVAVKLVKLKECRPSSVVGSVTTESNPTLSTPEVDGQYEKKLEDATNDLIEEAKLMAKVGYHQNVLSIVGVSTCGQPKMLIVSYCEYGSLLHTLKMEAADGAPLTVTGKLQIAAGIVEGMSHLIENHVVHRDLAARNVLLASGNTRTRMVPRVADFGLSRMAEDSTAEYYRSTKGVFAIRWTSPEAMETLKFTEASDVWSFGIVLVEIFQDGGSPYPGILSNPEVYALTMAGSRHWQPAGCSDGIYAVMMQCWDRDLSQRPSFKTLAKLVTDLAERRSEDALLAIESDLHEPPCGWSSDSDTNPSSNQAERVNTLDVENLKAVYPYEYCAAIPTLFPTLSADTSLTGTRGNRYSFG
jgi:serine/threonine protein kinase